MKVFIIKVIIKNIENPISLGSGNSFVPFSYRVVGLNPDTVYYYCAIANSSQGTSFGLLQTFKTLPSLFSKKDRKLRY
jgi:hypothetical protein